MDRAHAGEVEDPSVVEGDRAAGEPGARPPGDERHPVLGAGTDRARDLLTGFEQQDAAGNAAVEGEAVAVVEGALPAIGQDSIGGEEPRAGAPEGAVIAGTRGGTGHRDSSFGKSAVCRRGASARRAVSHLSPGLFPFHRAEKPSNFALRAIGAERASIARGRTGCRPGPLNQTRSTERARNGPTRQAPRGTRRYHRMDRR